MPRSTRRALTGWLAVLGALLAGVAWFTTSDVSAQEDEIARGAELFQRNCAVCHATDGSGVAGVGPPLTGFSFARIDLSMRTGRMPLDDPRRGIRERTFTTEERRATMAYLADELDLDGERPDPPSGKAAIGRELYAVNCAQCHGATGKGGVAGDGVEIPHVVGLDDTTIAAAVREGPFSMPHFSSELISDEEIGHIAAFLDEDVHQPNSPLGLEEVGELNAIFFAALLTAAVVLVCLWAAGRREGRPAPPPSETGEEDG